MIKFPKQFCISTEGVTQSKLHDMLYRMVYIDKHNHQSWGVCLSEPYVGVNQFGDIFSYRSPFLFQEHDSWIYDDTLKSNNILGSDWLETYLNQPLEM